MQVTAVSTWFPTNVSPATGAFVVKDLHAIAKAGVKVRLLHLVGSQQDDGIKELNYQGIEVRRLVFNTTSPLSIARVARQIPAYLKNCDLVHSMAMSTLAPLSLVRIPQPWVHTEHWSGLTNPDTLTTGLRLSRPIVLALEKLPDIVTSVCPYLSAPLRRSRGSRPTVEVPCVVEPQQTLRPRRVIAPSDTWKLISVGGLVDRKDPLMAVQVLTELKRMGYSARLTWLGSGPLTQATLNAAKDLNVEVDLPGPQPFSEVSRRLQEADLFLGPTHGDNFFVSCAEAILHGRPVVVGNAGGHPGYMKSFVGRALEGHDPYDYARAIVDILTSPSQPTAREIADSIGEAFSSETVGSSYRKVYEAALSKKKAGSKKAMSDLLAQLPAWNGSDEDRNLQA